MSHEQTDVPQVRIPIWRRLTATVSLGLIVVVMGFAIAALLGASALLVLFLLERAAG